MKLSVTAFALVALASHVSMALDDGGRVDRQLQFGDFMDPKFMSRQAGDSNGNGNGEGHGPPDHAGCNGQGQGPPDHVLQNLPDHVLEKFIEDNHVKPCRSPAVQEVNGNTVNIGGSEISLDDNDLTPLDVFSRGARVLEDGLETVLSPLVFKSNLDDSVTITKGADGKLLSATKRGTGNGRGVNLDILPLPLSDNYFAELDADDISDDLLSQFKLGDAQTPPGHRHLQLNLPVQDPIHSRSLQTVYKIVELDIVLDSYFCAAYGNNPTNAQARAISIVVEASKPYEVFNVKLKIKSLSIYCDAGSDPIRTMINSSGDTCNGFNTLLEQFSQYVSNSGTFSGDLVHLFYGFSFHSAIGCAYLNSVCDNYWRTGVNEMTYTGSLLYQGVLLAHEVGHNLAAEHINTFGFIMYPSVCSSCTSFSSTSISSITNAINSAPSGCISQESDGPPTPVPTPSPTTPAPLPAPTTQAPVCMDDPNFWIWLCGWWCFWADCYWFSYNFPEWYCGYQAVYDNCPQTCNAC